MFIKPFPKYNRTSKQRYAIYKLCESYRFDGHTRHRVIIGLGKLDELPEIEQKRLLARRIEEILMYGINTLCVEPIDSKTEELATYFYLEIVKRKRYDVGDEKSDWETVDLSTIKNKDANEIGGEWLCKQTFNQLGIGDFLRQQKWPEDKISLVTTHIICRTVYPASELKTVSYIKENSAISDITGIEKDKITKDQLYSISHKLYCVKDKLERYLSKRTNELFDLEDKIILYDLTNTYFEGRMQNSRLAKFGRSKEKRKDARLVVLAVVINREGFLKYSNIFEGNMTDSKTLETVIDALSSQTSFTGRKPIVVMDAGIATDDNVKMLKRKGYDYLCVSRSNLKEYYADTNSKPIQGIQRISEGINRKGGTKKVDKVYERIGRLKQKYPSVHKYYEITVTDNGEGTATGISCKHKTGEDPDKKAGVYFLRTSLDENDEKTLWLIYNIIREIEHTFRVLKTDLDLRPIYHKTDDAAMAHLHLGLLAYWLVSTIRYQLKQKGFTSSWREIVRIMNTQKCVTTSIENVKSQTISIRQCTEPNSKVKQIYDTMNYKYVPFWRKKSVVPPAEILKINST